MCCIDRLTQHPVFYVPEMTSSWPGRIVSALDQEIGAVDVVELPSVSSLAWESCASHASRVHRLVYIPVAAWSALSLSLERRSVSRR